MNKSWHPHIKLYAWALFFRIFLTSKYSFYNLLRVFKGAVGAQRAYSYKKETYWWKQGLLVLFAIVTLQPVFLPSVMIKRYYTTSRRAIRGGEGGVGTPTVGWSSLRWAAPEIEGENLKNYLEIILSPESKFGPCYANLLHKLFLIYILKFVKNFIRNFEIFLNAGPHSVYTVRPYKIR